MKEKIINPFRYLPMRQAWCWGIVALILVSVLCWQVGLRLTSLTQINYLGDHLWAATLRQIVAWLLFSVMLYLTGVAFSRSKVRFGDVAAFNLFARIPFDLSLVIYTIPSIRSIMGLIMDGSLATVMQYTNQLLIISLASLLFVVWYFYWTYKAFAEATNLKNGRGVGIFVVVFLIAYVVSPFVLRLF